VWWWSGLGEGVILMQLKPVAGFKVIVGGGGDRNTEIGHTDTIEKSILSHKKIRLEGAKM
jgi:hypothetical protein